MRKNAIVVFYFLILLVLCACNKIEEQIIAVNSVDAPTNHTDGREDKAQIIKVNTDLEMKNGWHIVAGAIHTMTISVEAENVDTILLWITPTGTGTWGERTLIGYDIDGSDGWSIEWEFGNRVFHDHLTVQALGSDVTTQAIETINVHSVDETNED